MSALSQALGRTVESEKAKDGAPTGVQDLHDRLGAGGRLAVHQSDRPELTLVNFRGRQQSVMER